MRNSDSTTPPPSAVLRAAFAGSLLLFLSVAARAQAQAGHQHAAPASATADSAQLAEQLAEVRTAVAPFATEEAALAAGFRRPASSTPTMGEHWANPSRVRDGVLDRAQPEILMYATVNGTRQLVGVAYLIPARQITTAPSLFTGDAERWHSHGADDPLVAALVGGEGRAQRPAGTRMRGRRGRRARPAADTGATAAAGVSMLHVWLVDASEGVFTDHNALLPFLAAGLPLPPTLPAAGSAERERLAKAALAIAQRAAQGTVTRLEDRLLSASDREQLRVERDTIARIERDYTAAVERGDGGAIDASLAALAGRFDAIRQLHTALPERARTLLQVAYGNMLGSGHSAHH